MKRFIDFILALIGFLLTLPIFLVLSLLIWLEDRQSPIYKAKRVGKYNKDFTLYKFRSMRVASEKTGVFSTSANDNRITKIGRILRRYKLDELPQLINIINGTMSFVGPRPNVRIDVDKYTLEEKKLLILAPGITDFSSIVFSDEGEILKDAQDPDLKYNQVIRPWKSRLGLIYIENANVLLDLKLIFWTFVVIFNRNSALNAISKQLQKIKCDEAVVKVSLRQAPLVPTPPPGADRVAS